MEAALRTPPLEAARIPSRPLIPAMRTVAAADAVAVLTPLLLVLARHHGGAWPADAGELLAMQVTIQDLGLLAIFGGLVSLAYQAAGLYDAGRVRHVLEELGRTCVATTAVVMAAALVATSSHTGIFDRPTLLLFVAMTLGAAAATRAIRALVSRHAASCRRAVIVGSGPHALRVCRELSRDPLRSYRVLGFVDTNHDPPSRFVARRTLGTLGELETVLAREHVDEVHIGLPIKSQYPNIQETIRICERLGVKVVYDADLFDTELAWPHVEAMHGIGPRVELHLVAEGLPVLIKRVVDVAGALAALVALAPVMVAAAVAIKLTSGGPIIFAQERYGLNRSRFRMLKFRTMVMDAERLQASLESRNEAVGPVFKIARDPRVTPVGRWLRRTSIDELPQLFNVLRGDMSLVGPRPLPIRDVRRFTRPSDLRRFSVRPGLTGLWQVSGRSSVVDFDRWVALDLRYIDRWSLALDAAILARTIPAVIRGTGAV